MKGLLLGVAGLVMLLVAALASSPPGPPLELKQIVPGAVVTQGFGCTPYEFEPIDDSCPQRHFHSGIDLAATAGTPVHAAAAGVARVLDGPGYGIHVLIRHDARTQTLYGHLLQAMVGDGQEVARGQLLGLVGSTGNSTGPHLHFEVRRDGFPLDPLLWLSR
jgi:murein DD-endopeptidase MepM/ murein hydrolase activator NlpD